MAGHLRELELDRVTNIRYERDRANISGVHHNDRIIHGQTNPIIYDKRMLGRGKRNEEGKGEEENKETEEIS